MTKKPIMVWEDFSAREIRELGWAVSNVAWELGYLKSHLKTKQVKDLIQNLEWAADLLIDELVDLIESETVGKRKPPSPFQVLPVSSS